MDKPDLTIIKIGGNVIDDETLLTGFLQQLSQLHTPFILVHGGGKLASRLSLKLGKIPQLINGRRVTDAGTLDITIMVYAGLVNKKIVARLQANGLTAIGLTGADANMIKATKRSSTPIDYGFVGNLKPEGISVKPFLTMLADGILPVIAPVTHDGKGQLLNTNADTIASCIAIALSKHYTTHLHYCFEKNGVLSNPDDETSVISTIEQQQYLSLKQSHKIHSGMIPKLDNAFAALNQGVHSVVIGHASQVQHFNSTNNAGTRLVK
jgi:acetylglutamate kinase